MLAEDLYIYRESLEPHLDKLSKDDMLGLFKYALETKGVSDAITTYLMFKFIEV